GGQHHPTPLCAGGAAVTILSLDGGKNIGWALFTDTGDDIDRGVISHEVFFETFSDEPFYVSGRGDLWFLGFQIGQLVVEGIRHNPNINQGGSQRWESQVEGGARILGKVVGVPVEVQPANILPTAMIQN